VLSSPYGLAAVARPAAGRQVLGTRRTEEVAKLVQKVGAGYPQRQGNPPELTHRDRSEAALHGDELAGRDLGRRRELVQRHTQLLPARAKARAKPVRVILGQEPDESSLRIAIDDSTPLRCPARTRHLGRDAI